MGLPPPTNVDYAFFTTPIMAYTLMVYLVKVKKMDIGHWLIAINPSPLVDLGKHSKQKSTELWFLTKQGGRVPDQTLKTKPIFINVRLMHFTLWSFTVANPGVKN